MNEFNLESIIKKPVGNRPAQFSGAIFLTYTLNLCFFEQVIQPALEAAGCQNILIISDPDGYNEALSHGLQNVKNAGKRYVCSFIPRKSNYVQHAKMLMLVGENSGRLLVGSGNLTLHGYSKNLENFAYFDYDVESNNLDSQYAFFTSNNLLKFIFENEISCTVAKNQYESIFAKAKWLKVQDSNPTNVFLWHNYEDSLWSQLTSWRDNSPFKGLPLKGLRIFSPYFDADFELLRKFAYHFFPDEISIRISLENTNFNGPDLINNWLDGFPLPKVFAIKDKGENQSDRLLHGKVIIGVENEGSWCLSGSANLTTAAFGNKWSSGSNLEMVTFHYSPNQNEFDYLSERSFDIRPLALENITPSGLMIDSDQSKHILRSNFTLTHLEYRDSCLLGHVDNLPDTDATETFLVLVKSQERISIFIDGNLDFIASFPLDFLSSEAAYIEIGQFKSMPRWIDFPEMLQKFSSRSYHQYVKSSLDTVTGTEGLFYELMKFIDVAGKDFDGNNFFSKRISRIRSRGNEEGNTEDSEIEVAPGPEQFIVPERDRFGTLIIDRYTQVPYDRNINSLQDLLSIILLRLTLSPSTENLDKQESTEDNVVEPDDAEKERQNACQRISNYLISYCKRYSQRICQKEFLKNLYPNQIFTNHFTLCRVLLEFNTHLDEFTHKDFVRCFWMVWSPLVWPELIGHRTPSLFDYYSSVGFIDNLLDTWEEVSLSSIFKIMVIESFGMPIPWSQGLYRPDEVNKYLAIKKLTKKIETHLGNFEDSQLGPDLLGISQYSNDVRVYKAIKTYLPPSLERISPLMEWYESYKNGFEVSEDLLVKINQNHLEVEFQEFQKNPKSFFSVDINPDDEGNVYCARCGASLLLPTISKIRSGGIALCDSNKDAWLYKKYDLVTPII